MRQHDRAARVRAIYDAADAAGEPPPTMAEVGEQIGISAGTVSVIVAELRGLGVRILDRRRNGLTPIKTVPDATPRLPLGTTHEQVAADRKLFERVAREWGWPE